MELGRYLVRELDFEDGVDTLGRWMAHHLAELIDQAENGPTADERSRARQNATETILKIWEHRASLPGRAYPLTSYKNVLLVLDRLRPDRNPFRYVVRHGNATRQQLAAELFDGLSRLVIALLLMEMPATRGRLEADPAASQALSEAEQHMLTAFSHWAELFEPVSDFSEGKQEEQARETERKVNLGEAALQLIDGSIATLDELRSEIEKNL